MLTETMKQLILTFNVGAVASVNPDGSPAVSPKATFVVLDDSHIAFGNIRSPGTEANLLARPEVEVIFTDLFNRTAVRITGRAQIIDKSSPAGQHMIPAFEALWRPYLQMMRNFVCIEISRAQMIFSPAYDLGYSAEELRRINRDKLCGGD